MALADPIENSGPRVVLQIVQSLFNPNMIVPWVWCPGKVGNLAVRLSVAETPHIKIIIKNK